MLVEVRLVKEMMKVNKEGVAQRMVSTLAKKVVMRNVLGTVDGDEQRRAFRGLGLSWLP